MTYSRTHYRLVRDVGAQQEDDGQGARRRRETELRAQAHQETLDRFTPLTANNAADAITWQEQRIQQLLREAK